MLLPLQQNNVSGETADARQTVKKSGKKKFSDVMFHYEEEDAEGGIGSCTISPIVSTEEQNTPSILNKAKVVFSRRALLLVDVERHLDFVCFWSLRCFSTISL